MGKFFFRLRRGIREGRGAEYNNTQSAGDNDQSQNSRIEFKKRNHRPNDAKEEVNNDDYFDRREPHR